MTVLNGDDPAMCVMCPAGHYCADGIVRTECPLGSFNPTRMASNASACQDCPAGGVTTFTGAVSSDQCVAVPLRCNPGTAGQECEPCGPGTYSLGGDVWGCQVCQAGTASQREYLSLGCDECPEGTYGSRAGQSLVGSCIPCGDGLRSDSGATSCSGCPAGQLLDSSSGLCISQADEPRCGADGMVCLPGVPEPVVAPTVVRELVVELPLPLFTETGSDASSSDALFSGFQEPVSSDTSVGSQGDESLARILRRASVRMDDQDSAAARDTGLGHHGHSMRIQRDSQPSVASTRRQLQDNGESSSDSDAGEDEKSDTAAAEQLAWVVSTCFIGALALILLVPPARAPMHSCLKLIDSMSMDHSPEQFAAMRRVSTPTGGWFTVAAILVALASSASLVL